jgi:hypothetical protein
MLALVIAHSKLMLLFLLIGTVVALSRLGAPRDFSSAHPGESADQAH